MLKKFIEIFFGRMLFVSIAFLLQLGLLFIISYMFTDYLLHFYGVCTVLSFLFVLHVVDSDYNPSYKISWIVAISTIPIVGWIFYRFFIEGNVSKIKTSQLTSFAKIVKNNLSQKDELIKEILSYDKRIYNEINYIFNSSHFPVYDKTETFYFSSGESMFESMLEELKKAEKYIFMEYFIIEEGEMWGAVLEILEQKAKEGVDVRIIYDDLGCLFRLPLSYKKTLEQKGIKCEIFNKINPVLSIRYNNRSHRKITVIDGKTAYTGGANMADEYINAVNKYGHWKDTAVMIKGEAVYSFAIMFLSFWAFLTNEVEEEYTKYRYTNFKSADQDGYVIPFTDTPLDNEVVAENVYMNIINDAVDYIFITTPYLILDNEMTTALCNASKKGVDVRIITPHIPDKKVVFSVTRANYEALVKSGIRVFEYTPGFMHAKNFVSDDKTAVVGTINLDYRSFYLHFECALWMHRVKAIYDIKTDFLETQKLSKEITAEDIKKIKKHKRIYRRVLKLLAPLM